MIVRVLIFTFLVMVLTAGCGVKSDSSSNTSSQPTDSNTTDPDSNTTDPDSNTTDPDSNTTDPDSNTTDPDSNTTDPVITPSIYDERACGHVDYMAIIDNSFYPAATFSSEYGLGLTSYYPKTFSAATSEIFLFHPIVKDVGLDNLGNVLVITDKYSFSYDRTWVENSNRTIYIRSPLDSNGNYECYRYELNTTNPSDLEMVLVHRN